MRCRYLPQCLRAISVQRRRVNGNGWRSVHFSAPQLSHNKQHSYKQTQVSTPSASDFVGRIDSCSSYTPNMCRISMRPQQKFPEQTFIWMGEQEAGGMCFVRMARIKNVPFMQIYRVPYQITIVTEMLTHSKYLQIRIIYSHSLCSSHYKYLINIPCKMVMTHSLMLHLA